MDPKSNQYTGGAQPREAGEAFRSVDHVTRAVAHEKLNQMSADDLVRSLREQGIGSLEELAKATVEAVRTAGQGGGKLGSVFLDDYLPYCYRFTSYRPFFDLETLGGLERFAQR